MAITKQFLQSEIQHLDAEIEKAKTFLIQAEAVRNAYAMLVTKCDEPEPSQGASDSVISSEGQVEVVTCP